MVGKLPTQGFDPNEATRLAEVSDAARMKKARAKAKRLLKARLKKEREQDG